MESFAMSFASMLLALAVVIAIAWVALRLLRDRMQPRAKGQGASDDMLRFVRALPVGAKERVVIVEHRGGDASSAPSCRTPRLSNRAFDAFN